METVTKPCNRCGRTAKHRPRGDVPGILRWCCNDCLADDSRAYRMTYWVTQKLHDTYRGILARCTDPDHLSYGNYGARGVRVCRRWRKSRRAFLLDVGKPPSPSHSLDRIRLSRGYSKKNVRWATPEEQAANRRTSLLLTFEGETLCAAQWARKFGLNPSSFRKKLKRVGYAKLVAELAACPLFEVGDP